MSAEDPDRSFLGVLLPAWVKEAFRSKAKSKGSTMSAEARDVLIEHAPKPVTRKPKKP